MWITAKLLMVIIYGKVSCIELLVLYTLKKQYYTTPLKSHDSCGCARVSNGSDAAGLLLSIGKS